MVDSVLDSFLSDYDGENSNSISRFREYRERHSQLAGFSILLLIIAAIVHEGLSFRVSEFPWPFSRYILYMLVGISILLSFVVQFGLRGVDMDHTRFSHHHIREAIQSYKTDDYEGVIHHIKELHEDVDNTNNEVFSKKAENAISDFYETIDEAEMVDSVIENEFEEFSTTLVREIESGEALGRQTAGMMNEERFEGSVIRDAAHNLGIRPLQIAPFAVVGVSAGIYFYVDKDAGYAIGMLLLSALGVADRS